MDAFYGFRLTRVQFGSRAAELQSEKKGITRGRSRSAVVGVLRGGFRKFRLSRVLVSNEGQYELHYLSARVNRERRARNSIVHVFTGVGVGYKGGGEWSVNRRSGPPIPAVVEPQASKVKFITGIVT